MRQRSNTRQLTRWLSRYITIDAPVNAMDSSLKIIEEKHLRLWRKDIERRDSILVVTNGCFDLLHIGHIACLERARRFGDILLVGVNSDRSVQQIKGNGRPIIPQYERAAVVAALEAVNAVCVFSDASAANFLANAQPHIYVKGADYTQASLNPLERDILIKAGSRIEFVPLIEHHSTTNLISTIATAQNNLKSSVSFEQTEVNGKQVIR